MASMNWTRASAQHRLAREFDYSEWFDQLGETWVIADAERRDRYQKRAEARRELRRKTAGSPRTHRPSRRSSPAKVAVASRRAVGPTKRERDLAVARGLGITVDELKARRREQARRDARLAAEARRRGVTTKQLRRQLAGQAAAA